ncbi:MULTISPECIES: PP2C family protein-serine/threonine phosphatase [unclassified Streptomyces]|uniref:PP2C family protein-serine/threonine phosphatase n=1 Tax=unclassified Streptomyces TaxID=2593676 RepID=UPI000371D16E|nr:MULTISPECIES: PP2C family protein-serine/threonine phosphatase [unclassified Streptomyces]MYT27687.1 SpoIIE family protein phosphatase [Streptomyces sp. SID8354]
MRVRRGPSRSGRPWRLSRGLIAVPLALIAAVTALDINSPTTIHLGPFLVAAPALTASFAGARLTAAVGALAVAAQVLIGHLHGGLTTPNHEAQIAALFVLSVLVTVFRYARDRHQRQLSQVRSVAVAAQQVLLWPLPRRIGRLRIESAYISAEAEAEIGGDLYGAVPLPGGVRLVIGDVRGKGLAAIGEAAALVGAFRGSAYQHLPLPAAVAHLGNSVYWNQAHAPEEDPESFITALVMDVHDTGPNIELVNCGHPPPLLLREGRVRSLEVAEPAVPLGLTAPAEGDYKVETFAFAPGEVLLLYTDGVIETRDRSGTFYPLTDRLTHWNEPDPAALVRRLHDDLLRFADGNLGDDVAMIAITRPPEPGPDAPAP